MGLLELDSIRCMGNIRTVFKYMNAGGNPGRPGQEPNLPEQVGFAFVSVCCPRKMTTPLQFMFISQLRRSWNQRDDRHIVINLQGTLFFPRAQIKAEK